MSEMANLCSAGIAGTSRGGCATLDVVVVEEDGGFGSGSVFIMSSDKLKKISGLFIPSLDYKVRFE